MPPRAPRLASVTAMTMVKSALAMRLIQILRPLITQSVAVLHRPGLHAGGIAARARLGDGDGRDRLARGVGLEVLLALLRTDRRQHHVEVGRIGREGEGHRGVAQLLVDADQRHRRQVGAARLLRHVERPQAELLALLEELHVLLVAERRRLARREAVEDVLLERHQLVAHELLHQIAQHLVFFAYLVHAALLWLSDALVHEFQRIGAADVEPLGHARRPRPSSRRNSASARRSWRRCRPSAHRPTSRCRVRPAP